jgi:tetratricopeptide (TPR) repeat protein
VLPLYRTYYKYCEGEPLIVEHIINDRKFKIVMTLLLVAAVIAVYIQVRDFSFISFDDDIYVYNCPQVQEGFTLQNFIWCFKSIHANNWHPLTSISLFLDSTFFGINPTAYHLENMFFHIVNSILLLLVLSLMTGFFWRSFFVAAMFALHPLHVESVAWVSERKDVLCTMFWMLTLLSYWWYTKSPKVKRYSLVLLFMVLGFLSKSMIVTLPFVLLLLDYWPLRRFQDSDIFKGRFLNILWEKMPLFLVVMIFNVITFMVQNYSGMVKPTESFRIDVRIFNAIVSYVAYLGSMIWPIKLAILYPYPLQIMFIKTLFAGLMLFLITFIALKFIRKVPYLTMGWFWYLGTLVPVIGFIQVGLQARADRYTYIPLIGIFIIIAWGIPDLLTKFSYKVPVLVASATAILVVYTVMTWYQVGYWRNSETIYNHALSVTENNFIIHALLAKFLENNRIDESIEHYREAIRIKPNYVEAHFNLGENLLRSGNLEGSKDQFNWILSQPHHEFYANAHIALGIALSKQNRIEEAIKHYKRAMQINPSKLASSLLESAFSDKINIESTIQKLEDQLIITPGNMRLLYKLTVLYSSVGQEDKSISHLLSMSRIQPDNPDIYYNLACIYSRQNKINEAVGYLQQAIDKGFNKWDLISKDPDLLNIRRTEYVINLINIHKT